ncbi:MAG: hypothetical protein KKB59_19320, partial [Spirochaetes bacterium]|nr:hypothetical protein [Spirochaetota bacterium]
MSTEDKLKMKKVNVKSITDKEPTNTEEPEKQKKPWDDITHPMTIEFEDEDFQIICNNNKLHTVTPMMKSGSKNITLQCKECGNNIQIISAQLLNNAYNIRQVLTFLKNTKMQFIEL